LSGPCPGIEFIAPLWAAADTLGPLTWGIGRVVRLTTSERGATDVALAIERCEILRVPEWRSDGAGSLLAWECTAGEHP
jgi:hypothetical protein